MFQKERLMRGEHRDGSIPIHKYKILRTILGGFVHLLIFNTETGFFDIHSIPIHIILSPPRLVLLLLLLSLVVDCAMAPEPAILYSDKVVRCFLMSKIRSAFQMMLMPPMAGVLR